MITLQQASEIIGRPITTRWDGHQQIEWSTDKHDMSVFFTRCHNREPMEIMVFGEPKPWTKGSEVRKGRPRSIWVRNPSLRYLRGLAR